MSQWSTGITLANDSFKLVWRHKKLMLYSLLSSLAVTGITIFLYWLFMHVSGISLAEALKKGSDAVQGMAYNIMMTSTLSWTQTIFRVLIPVAIAQWIINFFAVCLAHATMHILRNQPSLTSEALKKGLSRWRLIDQWSLATTFIALALQFPQTSSFDYMLLVAGIIIILKSAWNLLTFFVIPIIATERVTLLRALKLSISLAKETLWGIIGGLLWIAVVTIVLGWLFMALPLALGLVFLASTGQQPESLPLLIIPVALAALVIGTYVSAVDIAFRTLAFDQWYKKPLEQLLVAEHDLSM